MLNALRRFLTETVLRRPQAPPATERRIALATERATERLVRRHVENALMFVDVLGSDMSFDRAIDRYLWEADMSEEMALTVATRVLVSMGEDLPLRARRGPGAEDSRPPKSHLGPA